MFTRRFACLAVISACTHASAAPPAAVAPDGLVHVPAFDVPLSTYMSEEARRAFIDKALHPPAIDATHGTDALRKTYDQAFYTPRVERARARYPVGVKEEKFGGVRTDVVLPSAGISPINNDRVLVNLHGGGFGIGAGLGGLLEAMPIAALGRIKVISVDYRQGPEYAFPAASEDVAAVYRALLTHYKPSHIGLYGCSAGGQLAAMSVAWFQKEHLPRPGAIGIFCAVGGAVFGGDSRYTAVALMGHEPPAPGQAGLGLEQAYLGKANLTDPLASPIDSAAVLAKFPPTLIITGTRSEELSAAVYTHTQLVKAGVDAELHVWDGMWHAFFYDVDLPESQEAFDVVVKFFERHLGR